MTAKQYLARLSTLDMQARSKGEVLEQLRSLEEKVNATLTDASKENVSTLNKRESVLLKIAQLEEEIINDMDMLVTLSADAYRSIQGVDDDICRVVLEKKYLEHEQWEDIALDLCMSVRTVHRIHGEALQRLARIMEESKSGG